MFENRIEIVREVRWSGEGRVELETDVASIFAGASRKDFFCPEDDWESRIKPGARLRYWTIQYSRVMGIEWLDGQKWVPMWAAGNDFQTRAEREESNRAYANFIETEGALIARLIDEGKGLEEIDAAISEGHTGNTYGCALHIGIKKAEYRANAERIRQAHNAKYGVHEGTGTVNPAILTISEKP